MPKHRQLHPREQLTRETFTPAEWVVFGTAIVLIVAASWGAAPRAYWILGFFPIIAGLTPFILHLHRQHHPFFVHRPSRRFGLLTIPAWLFMLQFCLGLFQDPLRSLEIDGGTVYVLEQANQWLPISTRAEASWLVALAYVALFVALALLFLIPKARAFFERLLPLLCVNAVLLSVVGYLFKATGMEAPLFTPGTGQPDFFAFFPYDGHWAAFAILWTSACVTMALLTARHDKTGDFLLTKGPWYLTGAILLGGTGFLVRAYWGGVLLLTTTAVLLVVAALYFARNSGDRNRMALGQGIGALGLLSLGGALFRFFTGSTPDHVPALRAAAVDLFREQPVFGWGFGGFADIFPFYADDLLLGHRFERAGSDVLHYTAELGIAGCLPLLLLAIVLLIRRRRKLPEAGFSRHLLLGCLGLFALAFVDTPFMSPAVFASFWLLFFSALRWVDVDQRTSAKQPRHGIPVANMPRQVPFFADTSEDPER